jgi:hypothetical protein
VSSKCFTNADLVRHQLQNTVRNLEGDDLEASCSSEHRCLSMTDDEMYLHVVGLVTRSEPVMRQV